jgi:hypothetical protein
MTEESIQPPSAEILQPDSAIAARQKSEQQLRYRRLLRDQFDEIVELVNTTVQRNSTKHLSRSQLSSVIAVAQESNSVPVVIGYIQYQMVRDRSDWRENRTPPRSDWLGSYVITTITGEITTLAQHIAEASGMAQRGVHIDLTKLYLGYLRRAFIASGQTR